MSVGVKKPAAGLGMAKAKPRPPKTPSQKIVRARSSGHIVIEPGNVDAPSPAPIKTTFEDESSGTPE